MCGDTYIYTKSGLGSSPFKDNLIFEKIEVLEGGFIQPKDVMNGEYFCKLAIDTLKINYDLVQEGKAELQFPSVRIGPLTCAVTSILKVKIFGRGLFIHEIRLPDTVCGVDSHLPRIPKWQLEALSCGHLIDDPLIN